MPLVEPTLWGTVDRVQVAIDRLKAFEPPEGYYGAFSGGKESVTIKKLVEMAGVKCDWHYNLTTVDPPEVVRFIREQHPDVVIEKPKRTMWEMIVAYRMPPTRLVRYCCAELKEHGGENRVVLTGIRTEESVSRSRRKMVEQCHIVQKSFVHAILDWSEQDVWAFIRQENIPYCSLYDEGFRRIGCIMCPFGHKKQMMRDAKRWPKYYQSYLRAFAKVVEEKNRRGDETEWATAEDVMAWWMSDAAKPDPNQMSLPGDMV